MQAIDRQLLRAPDRAPVNYDRHHSIQTALYHLLQQHGPTCFHQAEAEAGAALPRFVQDKATGSSKTAAWSMTHRPSLSDRLRQQRSRGGKIVSHRGLGVE